MKSTILRFVLLALTITVVLLARENRRLATVAAQEQSRDTLTRIFAGSDGLTHIERVELKFSPAVQGHEGAQRSAQEKAASAYVMRIAPGFFSDWHHADHRRYVLALQGRAELEIANGEKVITEPHRLYLAEDLTGKGHTFRVIGNEKWVALFVDLDQ
jgi:hypothetical protein